MPRRAHSFTNSALPFMLSWSVSAATSTPFFTHAQAISAGESMPSE